MWRLHLIAFHCRCGEGAGDRISGCFDLSSHALKDSIASGGPESAGSQGEEGMPKSGLFPDALRLTRTENAVRSCSQVSVEIEHVR